MKTSVATVYHANGRRFFTLAGAYVGIAREMIAKKYPCDCSGFDVEDHSPCLRHADPEATRKLTKRLARWMRWVDRKRAA